MHGIELKDLRLAITCGGTGGHFYPGLSIARRLRDEGGKALLFLSGKNTVSQAEVARSFGLESVVIPSSPRPANPVAAARFVLDFITGVALGRRRVREFNPHAFLAMGSFASFSSSMAARSLGIPLFLHEGNARVGKANLMLSRFATGMALGFPAVNPEKIKCPSTLVGMPVRKEVLESACTKPEAIVRINTKHSCGLSAEKPLILIFGGSQGAATFNKIIPQAAVSLDSADFQIIHLAGKGASDEARSIYGANPPFPLLLLDSSPDMGLFYSAAGLVICRSGGSTTAELACFGKAALMVPYPYAADLHQDDNAAFYKSSGAAEVVRNSECTVEKIKRVIGDFAKNPDAYSEMGEKGLALARPNADIDTLEMILKDVNA